MISCLQNDCSQPRNTSTLCTRWALSNISCHVSNDFKSRTRICGVGGKHKGRCWCIWLANLWAGVSYDPWRQFCNPYSPVGCHDDVIKRRHFPRYWPFVRGIHRHRRIPLTKDSDAELWCFRWSATKQTVEQTFETPMIWDAIVLIMTSMLCVMLHLILKQKWLYIFHNFLKLRSWLFWRVNTLTT